MHWILASLLMYVFSVLLYLTIRALQKRKVPKEVYSIWMFGLPAVFFLVNEYLFPSSYSIGNLNWFLLVFSSIFFSWLGNVLSVKSIELSPNPGYSLIISKSYVVYTAIASIWLFGSKLGLKAMVGMILILFFSWLITSANPNSAKKSESLEWFWLAMGAFFCWGSLALASKYNLTHGVSVNLRLLTIHIIVTSILFAETKLKRISLKTNVANLPLLAFAGISGGLFNYFMQVGIKMAPNPGFVNATNAASISAVTILSALIFGDNLSFRKLIGVFGVTIGLIMLMV